MMPVSGETPSAEAAPRVDLALCVDPLSLRRFRASLRYLCVGLLDVSAQVRLVTSSLEAESLMLGSVQLVLYKEPPWPFRGQRLRHVLEVLAARPPNIVHGFAGASFDLAETVAHHFDSHLILHAAGRGDVEALAARPRRPTPQVIAASQPLFEALREVRGLERHRLRLVRPGVIGGEGPTCFSQPGRVPTLLCTSRLNPDSRLDRLLEALRLVRERKHEFLAFLTGAGPMEHALRRTAQAGGLASVVTFAEPLGGAAQIMGGADIFVRPAVEDMLSVRTLQAMAAGLAVVTVQGGIADAHLNEVTGLVTGDSRPETLAAAIARLLENPPFARTLAANAVEHIRKCHSVSGMSEALIGLYNELALRDKTLSVHP